MVRPTMVFKSTREIVASMTSPGDKRNEALLLLPILIIPGFMSSGLEIKQSSLQASWEGIRVWINLVSLGFNAMHLKRGAVNSVSTSRADSKQLRAEQDDDDIEENNKDPGQKQHDMYKNMWLQHMALNLEDMRSERPGVQVRAMKGISAVDFLSPGTLTNHISYVFGPVIRALHKVGYQDGVNLDAAPYDWRLSPTAMQERDNYFKGTMEKVEALYEENGESWLFLFLCLFLAKPNH
jgi:hypothetical protein